MALSEKTIIGSREILADGTMQVRSDTVISRDVIEISRTHHRHVVAPGDPIDQEHPSVQRIAKIEHTPAVVSKYLLDHSEDQ